MAHFDPRDVRVTAYSNTGGSAVHCLHLPTMLEASVNRHRSSFLNQLEALDLLREKVRDAVTVTETDDAVIIDGPPVPSEPFRIDTSGAYTAGIRLD